MNSVLKEQIENFIELKVIQNSDELYKQEVEWAVFEGPKEINDFEKEMLKDSKNPAQLLEEESNYIEPELSEEQKEKNKREEYIQRVKVIALHMAQKPILSNPSLMKLKDKEQIIKNMQAVIDNMTEEDIFTRFNEIVREELFDTNFNYEKMPLKPQ